MGLANVTVNSQHGVERLMVRATPAQKKLIQSLRENGRHRVMRSDSGDAYRLVAQGKDLRSLSPYVVEKLISQEFLVQVGGNENLYELNKVAR